MARGKVKLVTCEFCGARVPKSKAASIYRKGRKVYVCIRCAKKRGIKIKF